MKLQTYNQIIESKKPKHSINSRELLGVPKSGIYFLIDDLQSIVYIGKSSNLKRRISAHTSLGKIDFTYFSIIEYNESLLSQYEQLYILDIRPEYNISNGSSLFKKREGIKQCIRGNGVKSSFNMIHKKIDSNELIPKVTIGGLTYYSTIHVLRELGFDNNFIEYSLLRRTV